MAELNERPVCLHRNENPRGKIEAQGLIGISAGIKPSATGEDQILIATAPELDRTGTRVRTVGRSRCYFFPQDNDPLRAAFKFAGIIPTEFASDKPQLEVPDDDLESIQPGGVSSKTWYPEADPTTVGQRVQSRTDRPQTDHFIPDLPKKVGRKKGLSKGPLDQADLTKVDPARWVTKTAHNALRNYTVHKTAEADTINIPHRRERLGILDGTSAYEAIGRMLPNKGGTMIRTPSPT
jgi:hypothetical protein